MENKIVLWIIDKTDTSAYRSGKLSCGEKHPKVDGKMMEFFGGREAMVRQARELERVPELKGKISFDWRDMYSDIKAIHYDIAAVPILCKFIGIEDPQERQKRNIEKARVFLEDRKGTWLEPYFRYALEQLEKGNTNEIKVMEDDALLHCLREMSLLHEPEWKRVFSARVFETCENVTPSKVFEKVYQGKILEVLRKSPLYEDEMTVDEALEVHGILTYSQTLEWKGNLIYRLTAGTEAEKKSELKVSIEENPAKKTEEMVSTKENIYGTVINAQTLEHAIPVALPGVKRILVIENKANYESMPFDAETLYIYCHGFFSPKEVQFLKKIRGTADSGTRYEHWGDMDYGGIRIFLYNERNIFPELEPYHMSDADYEKCIRSGKGISLEEKKRRKLEALDAGKLESLKKAILKNGIEIEQEMQMR